MGREACFGAAGSRVLFVVGSVAHHLRNGAAGTPEGTAAILTPLAVLFGNVVVVPNDLAGTAGGNQQVDSVGHFDCLLKVIVDLTHGRNIRIFVDARIVRVVGSLGQVQVVTEVGEDQIRDKENDDVAESLGNFGHASGLAMPVETHTSHHLGHCHCTKSREMLSRFFHFCKKGSVQLTWTTPTSEANMGMADSMSETIEQTILPLASDGCLSLDDGRRRLHRYHEPLVLLDTPSRLFQGKRRVRMTLKCRNLFLSFESYSPQ